MPKVQFYGGPYDGKECELPFCPELLIGETMDGPAGRTPEGKIRMDLRVSTYIYQLTFPNGEEEPFAYQYRRDRPKSLDDWLGLQRPNE